MLGTTFFFPEIDYSEIWEELCTDVFSYNALDEYGPSSSTADEICATELKSDSNLTVAPLPYEKTKVAVSKVT